MFASTSSSRRKPGNRAPLLDLAMLKTSRLDATDLGLRKIRERFCGGGAKSARDSQGCEFLMAHCPQSQAECCLNKQRLFFPNYHLPSLISERVVHSKCSSTKHSLFSQSSSLYH